jgi:Flp pilus assembly pilin Flp
MEYALLVSAIALTEVAALTELSCAISVSYAEDALKVEGATEVTADWSHCRAKGKSCKITYPQYIPLNQLWYPFTSQFTAYQVATASNGGKQPKKGGVFPATDGPCGEGSPYVVGTHQNLYFGNEHVGDIVSCTACDDSMGDPTLVKRWDYIP